MDLNQNYEENSVGGKNEWTDHGELFIVCNNHFNSIKL